MISMWKVNTVAFAFDLLRKTDQDKDWFPGTASVYLSYKYQVFIEIFFFPGDFFLVILGSQLA